MSFYSDFAEHYEAVFPFREPVCKFLSSHLHDVGARILDIGCGTGHYVGRLAAEGHSVTGIDLDDAMIAVARRKYPAASFRTLDMAHIGDLEVRLDLAFCIGNVAAHLPHDRTAAFLADLAGLLEPGAHWIFQVVNWDFILQHEQYGFPDKEVGGEGVVFQREYRDISPSGLRFCTRLASAERTIFAGEVRLYPIPARDYLRLHRQAGFELEGHFADFQRKPFSEDVNSGSVYVFRRA